jgi:hypothetical protein
MSEEQAKIEDMMDWHAKARVISGPVAKVIVFIISIPVLLFAGFAGIMNGMNFGFIEGLKLFGVISLVCFVFFGFVSLIVLIIKPTIRMRYILHQSGVYAMEDDEVAREIIAAGGAFGVATGNLTMTATPLAAKAGRNGHVPWDKIDIVQERPAQLLFVLKRPGWWRPDVAVFASKDNYRDVRAFLKRYATFASPD